MGGKSKKVTVGYKYYLGEHMVLCHGPIDELSKIEVDERAAWEGVATGGQIVVAAEELFGGESREGGVSGVVDVDMGGPAQGQNSYLAAQLGSTVPAYRGVVSAILRQCYLGNNPYLKAWKFRGTRIHKAADGAEQWYDVKSAIPSISDAKYLGMYLVWQMRGSTPDGDGGYFVDEITPNAVQSTTFVSGDGQTYNVPLRVQGNTELRTYTGSTPLAGTVVQGGTPGPLSGYNVYKIEVSNPAATYYLNNGSSASGVTSINTAFTIPITDGATVTFTASSDDGRMIGTYQYLGVSIAGVPFDMNPAHIIRECLTNADWGMGYLEEDIDDVSFTYAADQLHAEGLGMSLLWDRQIQIDAFIQEIVKHIDAALYVDRTTGKFALKLIRDDYDPDSLIVLDESNISKVANPARSTFGELYNSVSINYWDVQTGKDASLTITDTALSQMQGAVINTTLQYPGFTNARNATIAGQRDLRVLSAPFLSCTIYADKTAENLNIGDTFKFSWSRWSITEMVMRVTGIAFGDGKTKQIRITCTQDVFSTPTVTVVNPNTGTAWVDPSAPPTVAANQLAFEAPYYELVQALGQSDIDSSLASKSDIGYLMATAAKPSSAINARLWVDDGGGYEDVGGLDFCPYAVLDSAMSKISTVVSYTGEADLDQVELGTHCQIGNELCRVDAIDTGAGTLTLGRGVLDTVPEEHEAGEQVFFWDLFSGYDPTEYVSGEEIDAKVQPVSGSGVVSLGDIAEQTVTMEQRAFRPYPPGDLRINTESYTPEAFYEDEIAISWAHRDRVQQTSGTFADHFDGDIGPEAGQVYRVQGYIDGVLVHTEDDIAGTSTTWTPSDGGLVKIEVHAKRDGVYSWQAPSHEFFYTGGADVLITEADDVRYTEEGVIRVTED